MIRSQAELEEGMVADQIQTMRREKTIYIYIYKASVPQWMMIYAKNLPTCRR